MANLRKTNLNLLPILRELLRHRNVTNAARALNMTQPAVSDALARLRRLFQDEILIPHGRLMVPSALAERLLPRLELSLGDIEDLIGPSVFDPALSQGALRIAAGDNMVVLLGAELARRINTAAPNLMIEFTDVSTKNANQLINGDIDLVISPWFLPNVNNEIMFEDDLVCIVDMDHWKRSTVRRRDFVDKRIIVYTSPGSNINTHIDSALQLLGLAQFKALRVQSFLLIPYLLHGTDNVGLVQRRLATTLEPSARIRIVTPPVPFPILRFVMSWSRAKEHDAEHRWLRHLVLEITEKQLR